jgi:polysaccharide biosynthesis transport protein
MMRDLSPYFIDRDRPSARGAAQEADYGAFIEQDTERVDLWQYWRTVRKHLGLILAIALVLMLLVGLHDFMATPLYTAQATILIKSSAPQVFEGTSVGLAPGEGGMSSPSDMSYKTEYQLLKSRSLAAQVIATQGLQSTGAFGGAGATATPSFTATLRKELTGWIRPYLFRSRDGRGHASADSPPLSDSVPQQIINAYLSELSVTPVSGTELVRVRFTTPDPKLSATLANAHVRQFIHQGIQLNAQVSEEAEQFLQKKLAELKQQLEESELALNNYRRDKGIIPGLISVNGKEDVVLDRLDKLSADVQQAHLKTITIGTQVALIKQGHADALPAVVESPTIQTLESQFDSLETQYAGMAGQFKPSYPPMMELEARIRGTREALRREVRSVVGSVKTQYLAALKKENTLDAELKHEKEFALGLNNAAVKYAILQRDADTNRQLYNAVLKRMKDVEVTADLHASKVSIVDTAVPPLAPSSPKKGRDLFGAAVLGLMMAIGFAFLLEYLDNTLKGPDEVESYLRVPNLGVIPDFSIPGSLSYAPRKLSQRKPPGNGDAAPFGREVVAFNGAHPVASEAYRALRTALLLSRAGAPPKTILVTSAMRGEGKTVTATNTAIILAGTGKKVLLLDADLRKPRCHKILAVENHLGLTEVLTGAHEHGSLIRRTPIENLFFLSSGETPPNPSELLGSDRMRELLTFLGERNDYIVIDGTPVLPVTDVVVLSTMVDGVTLVVGPNTPKQQARAALSRLEYARAKVLGAVLNKVNINSVDYNYYYPHYAYDYYRND